MPILPRARPRDRPSYWSEAGRWRAFSSVASAGFRSKRSRRELAGTRKRGSHDRLCDAGRTARRRRRHDADRTGLDPWGAIPLLRNLPLIGLLMRANRDARQACAGMIADPNYGAPHRWDAVDASAFDGLLLPGGHRARGMRDYLESDTLQRHVVSFFEAQKPWRRSATALLLAARSISKRTGRSVLYGYGRPL